jgi:hypothetical protein
MTKRRWVVLVGLLAVGVCLTLAGLALLPPRPGVTQANFDRIEDGMTREEVERILGGPGRLVAKNGEIMGGPGAAFVMNGNLFLWDNPRNDTIVSVSFDDANRVIGKDWKDWGPPETFLQKLQRLLHL